MRSSSASINTPSGGAVSWPDATPASKTSADFRSDAELADVYFRENCDNAMFTVHLNVLARHGCRFTKPVSLEWAKGYANLPVDLGD